MGALGQIYCIEIGLSISQSDDPRCGRKMKNDLNTRKAMYASTPIAENQAYASRLSKPREKTLNNVNPLTRNMYTGPMMRNRPAVSRRRVRASCAQTVVGRFLSGSRRVARSATPRDGGIPARRRPAGKEETAESDTLRESVVPPGADATSRPLRAHQERM